MKVKTYDKNIIHIIFPNQKEMGMSFCRIQEFYESNKPALCNNIFTYEEFIDQYTDKNGYFEYFENWNGFNIPGETLENFFYMFRLTNRELEIKKIINQLKYTNYYLIGTKTGDKETLNHELLHAYYYMDKEYKQNVDNLVKNMNKDVKKEITKILKNMGYAKHVITDEINAYLSSSSHKYLKKELGLNIKRLEMKPFIELSKTVLRD